MKVMISLPMNGVTDEDVKNRMNIIKDKFERLHIDVIDSFINDPIEGSNNPNVYYLGRTIMNFMCHVDAVYFDVNWQSARGCRIERQICKEYGIKILDADFLEEKNYIQRG